MSTLSRSVFVASASQGEGQGEGGRRRAALAIAVDVPLDGFLGFERAPRTDVERMAAADLEVRFSYQCTQPQALRALDVALAR